MLLDRLRDDSADISHYKSSNQLLRDYAGAILSELANLLNSRRRFIRWSEKLVHLDQSALNYGLPDSAGVRPLAPADLEAELAAIIEKFEPRITNVNIQRHSENDSGAAISFAIEATLSQPGSDIRATLRYVDDEFTIRTA